MRDLEFVDLLPEEVEAMRLKNIEDLDQTECARRMNTSQSTFQRILRSAHKKVSQAIIRGRTIRIIRR